jgi:glycerate kinase
VISHTVLLAPVAFDDELSAARVAAAIGWGLQAGNASLQVDPCPIEGLDLSPIEGGEGDPSHVRGLLEELDFDTRMRAARAVVVGEGRLGRVTPVGGAMFEIATRARQAGVPAYAVLAKNNLDLFEARILDLQVVLEAREERGLRAAGRELAGLV